MCVSNVFELEIYKKIDYIEKEIFWNLMYVLCKDQYLFAHQMFREKGSIFRLGRVSYLEKPIWHRKGCHYTRLIRLGETRNRKIKWPGSLTSNFSIHFH